MKAANFLNVLLAVAVVLLCAKLYLVEARMARDAGGSAAAPAIAGEPPAAPGEEETVVVESAGATGYGGPVPVVVEVKDGVVVRVSPKLPNDESPMFFRKLEEVGLWRAWNGMTVEEASTAKVDAVASATYSSEAAIANVRAAVAAAAGKASDGEKKGAGGGAASASDFALGALGAGALEAIAGLVPSGDGGEGGPVATRPNGDGGHGEK
jgi:uncharacterized protein with FMN-binding domain